MNVRTEHRTEATAARCGLCYLIVRKVARSRPLTPGQAEHWRKNERLLAAQVSEVEAQIGHQPRLTVQQSMLTD